MTAVMIQIDEISELGPTVAPDADGGSGTGEP